MKEILCKRPGCDVVFRPKSPAGKYCGDVCRGIAARKYHKEYRKKQKEEVTERAIRFLSDEERKGKFQIGLQFIRGTVIHSYIERRAVKVIPRIGDPVVYMSTTADGLINVRAGRVAEKTFEELAQ